MYTSIEELDLWNQPDEGDPLIWLRKHREELSEKYPTIEALDEYYSQFSSAEEALERMRAKNAEKNSRKGYNGKASPPHSISRMRSNG